MLAATVLLACGGGDDAAAPRPTTTTAAPTTTVAPTTTTTDVTQLDAGGDDPVAALRVIWQIRLAAFQRPRADLLDLVYEPSCDCNAVARAQVDDLVRRGVHHVDGGPTISSAQVFERPGPDEALIDLTIEQGPQVVADGKGNRFDEGPAEPPARWVFTLVRSRGRWLIHLAEPVAAN